MNAPEDQPASDNVVPFEPRSPVGDWTPSELERLEELSRKLEAQGAHVETAYGISDAGDPWCVITNEADEVLMHVARIGGRFVIHDAAADALQDGDSLWRAFDRLLGEVWREGRQDGVVVPLHQAQALLALVVAIVFEHEVSPDRSETAPAPPAAHMTASPQIAALSTALSVTALADASHATPVAASASTSGEQDVAHRAAAAPATEARVETYVTAQAHPETAPTSPTAIEAGAADPLQISAVEIPQPAATGHEAGQLLVGTAGGDHLVGGPGADTLAGGGAPEGQLDVLSGGPGADRLLLAARTVAIGGPGADVFAFARPTIEAQPKVTEQPTLSPSVQAVAHSLPDPPPPAPPPPVPTAQGGVVLDFSADDHLDFGLGSAVKVVSVTPVTDVLAGLHNNPALSSFGVTPGSDVGFDLNGDNSPDLYVLFAGPAAVTLTVGMTFSSGAAAGVTPTHPTDLVASTHPTSGDFLLG